MTETIAVLVIFMMIVMFGFIFYTKISASNFERSKIEAAGEKAISTSLYVMSLPEIRCNVGNNVRVGNCVDEFKIKIAQDIMSSEQDYYFDFLRFSNISVQTIYPDEQTIQLYNFPKEGFTRKARSPIPVALYNPISREYRYGVLTIETFS